MHPRQADNLLADARTGVTGDATTDGSPEVSVEARAIVAAIRWLRANPEHLVEARTNLPAVLDRLRLAGTARHAVAATLALSLSAGVVVVPGSNMFWSV
jgi:hypothetical protein